MSGELLIRIGIILVAVAVVGVLIYSIVSICQKKRLNNKLTEEYGVKRG